MQKRMVPLLAAAAALLMVALFAVFFYFFGGGQGTPEAKAASQPAYILREYQGRLGVFTPGSETPEQVVDLLIELLPAYDQAELRSGVPIADDADLSRALEDYTS
ncbi:MAG: hypothetical protein ACOX64_10775 [Candidatus Merdivicinus sp.]